MSANPDFVSVLTMLAALVWSPAMSAVIGPYSAIICAASAGAAWSLGSKKPLAGERPQSRIAAALFFLRINAMAAMLTVLVCNALEDYVFHRNMKWALVPVALAIGVIGDGWPAVFAWLMCQVADRGKRAWRAAFGSADRNNDRGNMK